jgi:hypothetical protein
MDRGRAASLVVRRMIGGGPQHTSRSRARASGAATCIRRIDRWSCDRPQPTKALLSGRAKLTIGAFVFALGLLAGAVAAWIIPLT